MKNVKGITLIALVITIVVLIILAGVAISLSLGENGIFNKAKFATEEYANEQAREEAEIAKTANEIDSYVGSNREETHITSVKDEIMLRKYSNETVSASTDVLTYDTQYVKIVNLNFTSIQSGICEIYGIGKDGAEMKIKSWSAANGIEIVTNGSESFFIDNIEGKYAKIKICWKKPLKHGNSALDGTIERIYN